MILSDRVQQLLLPRQAERAAELVRDYFVPRPAGRFTGAHFERFSGGGDRPEVADQFTADDLVAVSMLSVSVVGDAALEVLQFRRDRLQDRLARIPTDVELADLAPDDLGEDWPVRALYRELVSIPDIGETTATKLMARKRPHLVPILDSVVTAELSIVNGQFWSPLHRWLVVNARANDTHLRRIRDLAGLGREFSVLRVFDVLVWRTGVRGTSGPARSVPSRIE